MRKHMRYLKVSFNLIKKLYKELQEQNNVVRTDNKTLRIENTKLQATFDKLTKRF